MTEEKLNMISTIDMEDSLAVKIRKQMTKAISDYHMLTEGDRIMVAVSGGKDSTVLSLMLKELKKKAPFDFEFQCVMLDQKQPGFAPESFIQFFKDQDIPLTVISEDTYSIVKEKVPEGNTYCSLCSRLRRGVLYTYAHQHQFTKIALGHHRDDMLETFLMNIFYSGKMASMPPKLYSKDYRNIVIRPLAYVAEDDIVSLRDRFNFPVIPCNLCGSQDGLKREKMGELLKALEKESPDLKNSMAHALKNIEVSHLMDARLFNFEQDDRLKNEDHGHREINL